MPRQKVTPPPSQTAAAVAESAIVSGEAPDEEWKDVSKMGRKTPNRTPQQQVPEQTETKERSEQEKHPSRCFNP